jgi:predicted MFS family arabinose efflux permease
MAVVEIEPLSDQQPTPVARRQPPSGSLRRNRYFLLLFGGQLVSAIGSQVSQLAFPLLILAITGSPAQAGFLGAMRGLAYVLLGLPAGAYVDRWNRKTVMILSDTGRAVALGSIPVALALGRLTLVQLYLVTFVEGMLFIFFGLAETAALKRIVRREQLPAAVSLNEGTYSLSGLLGPSVGGALYGFGRAFPFVADAVSYAVSALSVFFIRMEFQEERTEEQRHIREEIKEGLRWLWHQPTIRFLCWVNGGVNLLYGGWTLLLISLAQRHGASAAAIGLIFATGGVGTLLGTAFAAPVQRRFTVGTIMVWIAWLFVITWVPYAWAPNILWLGIVNAVGFLFVPIYVTTHFSYRLVLIPDALQGRVNSVFRLVTFGAQMIGFALMGVSLQQFGPVTTVYIGAIPATLLAVLTMINPQVRHAGRIADAHTA